MTSASDAILHAVLETVDRLTPHEREILDRYLSQFEESQKLTALQDWMQLTWRETPVNIRRFIEDEEYLNQKGQIYGKIVDDLEELFEGGYTEAIFSGAIGWGKSAAARAVLEYMAYQVGCLTNPARAYGLKEGSQPVLINVAVNKENARHVVFDQVIGDFDRSPWFQRHMPRKRDTLDQVEFQNGLRLAPFAAIESAVVGYDAFGGVLDEVNEMSVLLDSTRKHRGDRVYDQAQTLRNAILRRMQSRFTSTGSKLPGVLVQISSSKYPGEYTERRIEEAQQQLRDEGKTSIFWRSYSTWETNRKKFSMTTFKVALGTMTSAPKVIETEADRVKALQLKQEIVEVPDDLKPHFKSDIYSAIRDFIGRSTAALVPFITRIDKVFDAMSRGRKRGLVSPFKYEQTTLIDGSFDLQKFLSTMDPATVYFAHGDLAKNKRGHGDVCGIAIGHIGGHKMVVRTDAEGKEHPETVPYFVIDLVIEVVAPPDDEIHVSTVRGWFKELAARGMRFHRITFDQWQSLSIIQDLLDDHVAKEVEEQSVDKTAEPYQETKQAFYEDRIDMYEYLTVLQELSALERNEKTGKIDHPPGGCFTGETRVALADGTIPTFRELCERYPNGESFDVYTMTPEGMAIKKAHSPRITKTATELVEVTLDNFQVIRCTPEHLFMTLDGDWVQAQNLTPDISIMPLYRSISHKGGWADYERVWCPIRKRRFMTHQLAYGKRIPPGYHVHHRDDNKHNNTPENLELLSHAQHCQHHGVDRWSERSEAMRVGHVAYYNDPTHREAQRQRILRTFEAGKLKRGRAVCAIEGCDRMSNARGLCDKHYQRMKRRGRLPAVRTSRQNHRALCVRRVRSNEPVYDLTVPGTENFALASGVFVHNSKDVADALAGVIYSMVQYRQPARMTMVDAPQVDTGNPDLDRVLRIRDAKARLAGIAPEAAVVTQDDLLFGDIEYADE